VAKPVSKSVPGKAGVRLDPRFEARLDLSSYFPYLINRVGSLFVVAYTTEALDREDLTIAMWRVLAALSNNGGQRQIDLAERTSIEVSTLSRIVARLLRRGLITRKRSRDDNREFAVALSPAGQKLVRKLIPIARVQEKQAIAGLSPRDLEAARRVLRAMYGNLAGPKAD
jgi:DNA-binding MarR family transcriptional regulator